MISIVRAPGKKPKSPQSPRDGGLFGRLNPLGALNKLLRGVVGVMRQFQLLKINWSGSYVAGCLAFMFTTSVFVSDAFAQAGTATAISLQGKSEVVVTEPLIHLADVAHVESPRVRDDEQLIRLKRISIGRSPKAGETMTLEGTKILERLRDEGIRLEDIRYTLPREISVTRAFREVATEELERALLSFLERGDKQIEVKQLVVDKPIRIATDSNGVEVVALRSTHPGHFGVDYRSLSASDEARFQLRAVAHEWRTIPVASRPLKKGGVISAQDLELKRVAKDRVSRDTIENIGDVVGHQLTRDVGQGETLSPAAVIIPPVITSGSKVTLLFREGRLEATALGVALDSGIAGAQVRVRNESSNKIVTGTVVEPGMVSVGAQKR